MLSAGNKTFKLSWRLGNFSTSAILMNNSVEAPSTGLIALKALGGTVWQIDLYPCTENGWVACSFTRNPLIDEEVDLCFDYSIYLIGNGGARNRPVIGALWDFSPFTSTFINIILVEELTTEYLVNDHLQLLIEIQRLSPNGPIDLTRTVWEDELRHMSRQMRRLLETKYHSDCSLVTDDGYQIDTHAFMLSARWPELSDVLREYPNNTRLTIHHVPTLILIKFVWYLYTGKIHASDLTTELFDFTVKYKSKERNKFHTLFCDMCIDTRQVQDRLAFTWHLKGSGGGFEDFCRILPLVEKAGVDLLVEISTDHMEEPKLAVQFSLWGFSPPQWVHLQCSATLFVNENEVAKPSATHVLNTSLAWVLPDFAPMSLLTGEPAQRRVKFELEISYSSFVNRVETTVTKFHTGSRKLRNYLLLSNDLYTFFSGRFRYSRIFDVALRTTDSVLYSCRAILGARSYNLWCWVRDQASNGLIALDCPETNGQTVASILEYVHTGWIVVQTPEDAILIHNIAFHFGLRSLMEKCIQCWRILHSRI